MQASVSDTQPRLSEEARRLVKIDRVHVSDRPFWFQIAERVLLRAQRSPRAEALPSFPKWLGLSRPWHMVGLVDEDVDVSG